MDNAVAADFLSTAVVVRTDLRSSGMGAALSSAVQEVMPTLPVSRIRAVEDYASRQIQDLGRATVLQREMERYDRALVGEAIYFAVKRQVTKLIAPGLNSDQLAAEIRAGRWTFLYKEDGSFNSEDPVQVNEPLIGPKKKQKPKSKKKKTVTQKRARPRTRPGSR